MNPHKRKRNTVPSVKYSGVFLFSASPSATGNIEFKPEARRHFSSISSAAVSNISFYLATLPCHILVCMLYGFKRSLSLLLYGTVS